jgi:toxin ParE1/3/4
MKVVFASEVREEVEQARDYYENEVEGLGKAFVLAVKRSIDEIKDYPETSRVIRNPFRRFLTPRFPFGIIYRTEKEILYVVAVAHLRKRPFYWENRSV